MEWSGAAHGQALICAASREAAVSSDEKRHTRAVAVARVCQVGIPVPNVSIVNKIHVFLYLYQKEMAAAISFRRVVSYCFACIPAPYPHQRRRMARRIASARVTAHFLQ